MFKPFETFRLAGGAALWTSAALFAAGQAGHWSKVSEDMTMLFQDAAGTIPATLPDQPVGLAKRLAGSVDASQATALSRPTLARHPKGGRRNLYSQTNNMTTSAGWQLQGTPTQGGPIATPWGDELAYLFTNIASQSTFLRPPGGDNLLRGTTYTRSIRAKLIAAAPASSVTNIIALEQSLGSATSAVRFNMLTGTIEQASAGAIGDIIALGDGWYELTAKFTTAVSGGSEPGARVIYLGNYGGSVSASTFAISMPQLEIGSVKTPHQHVVSANDITETGKPDIWHLWNDGGDSLNAAPLPADTYGLAYVDALGGVTVTTATSDGTTPINLLRAERQAEVILRQGAFTASEEAQIRSNWSGRYAA